MGTVIAASAIKAAEHNIASPAAGFRRVSMSISTCPASKLLIKANSCLVLVSEWSAWLRLAARMSFS
jgi:hypothetical protein